MQEEQIKFFILMVFIEKRCPSSFMWSQYCAGIFNTEKEWLKKYKYIKESKFSATFRGLWLYHRLKPKYSEITMNFSTV